MPSAHLPVGSLDRIAPGILPTVGLTVTVTVGLSLLLPGHATVHPVAWAIVAVAGLGFLPALRPVGRRWWLRYGIAANAMLVAALVLATGGVDSAYQDLLAPLLVSSAILKSPRWVVADTVVVALAALAPVLGASVDEAYLTDLGVDLATWGVIAVTARLLATQVVGVTWDLAEANQRFHLLAEDVPAVVYRQALGGDHRLTWLNDATTSILGFTPEEMVADPELVWRQVPEEDREVFTASRREALSGDGVVRYRFDRADGTRIWLEDHYSVVVDEDGAPAAVLGVAFDVSGRVAAEQAEQDAHDHERIARRELGRVLAAQRSFVQGISHELRTPLTAVAGFADVLAGHGDELTPDQRRQLTGRLLANTQRLTALVDDLVDIDRLVGGGEAPTAAPADLRELLEDSLRGITTATHAVAVEGDPGVVHVDAAAFRRIVRQLVGNAVRHTPAGTRVRCRLARRADRVRLTVEDDGPGVPTSLGSRLFDPFVQGDEAAAHPNPGTGVGLALCATLARAHGGRAWHETPEDGGARFVVELACPPA